MFDLWGLCAAHLYTLPESLEFCLTHPFGHLLISRSDAFAVHDRLRWSATGVHWDGREELTWAEHELEAVASVLSG